MTNLQSFTGGLVWAAVAALLMLVTFEPVSIEQKASAAALQVTAEAQAAESRASI